MLLNRINFKSLKS